MAVGPALVFLVQLLAGWLVSSPFSLACAVFYAVFAVMTAVARRRAIRAAALAVG